MLGLQTGKTFNVGTATQKVKLTKSSLSSSGSDTHSPNGFESVSDSAEQNRITTLFALAVMLQ